MKGLFYKNSSMYKSIMQVSGAAGKKKNKQAADAGRAAAAAERNGRQYGIRGNQTFCG